MRFLLDRFPNDEDLAIRWKEIIGLDPHSNRSGMVCVNHFSDDDYYKATEKTRASLKKNVVPKLYDQFASNEPDNAAISNISNENELLHYNNIINEDEIAGNSILNNACKRCHILKAESFLKWNY